MLLAPWERGEAGQAELALLVATQPHGERQGWEHPRSPWLGQREGAEGRRGCSQSARDGCKAASRLPRSVPGALLLPVKCPWFFRISPEGFLRVSLALKALVFAVPTVPCQDAEAWG